MAERKPTGRKERIPLGTAKRKLTAPEVPGKVRRWINDSGTRLLDAENGGYTFVSGRDGVAIGDPGSGGNQDSGTKVSRVVGKQEDGSPMRAYLMEIDRDLYEEDQKEKMRKVQEIDDAIRNPMGQEGAQANNLYIPKEGIQYKP